MDFPHLVLARVYEHIEPIDRGDRYEDPLQATLEKVGIGRVTGGGSQLDELGKSPTRMSRLNSPMSTRHCGLWLRHSRYAGAPQGSELIQTSDDRVLREFGKLQCLAIYLDGTSLPDEVYANLDFEAVVGALGAAAGDNSFRGFWQGPQETGLFFFGPDAEAMFARVEPVLRPLPIGQNARVVIRHGKQSLTPREIRMPRH